MLERARLEPGPTTAYYVDSLTYRVDAFDYDGELSNRRPFATIDRDHEEACAHALRMLEQPEELPSARVLAAMAREHGNSYTRFVLALSRAHAAELRARPLPPKVDLRFRHLAAESLAEQSRIEAADKVDFETFRQRYLAPELLRTDQQAAR